MSFLCIYFHYPLQDVIQLLFRVQEDFFDSVYTRIKNKNRSLLKILERLSQCIKQSKLKQFKSNLIEYLNERCFYNLNGFLNYP